MKPIFIVFLPLIIVFLYAEDRNKLNIKRFTPSVFITKSKALLYEHPNGKAIMEFKKRYKFTAYSKVDGWIKVSGHFPNRRWRAVKSTLWIKEKFVKKIR